MNNPSHNGSVINNNFTSNSKPAQRLWPWIGFLLLTLLFDGALQAIAYHFLWGSFLGSPIVVYPVLCVLVAVVVGQLFLVMVISSLSGKTWINGYAAAVGLLVLSVLFANLGSLLLDVFSDFAFQFSILPAVFAIVAIATGILFSSANCLAFRALGGWRVLRQSDAPSFTSIGIADLIMGTALIALLVMLGNDVRAMGLINSQMYWEPILMLGGMVWVLSLTSILPFVWTVFRATRLRWLKLFLLVAVNSAVFGLIGGLFLEYAETATEPFMNVFGWGTLCGIMLHTYLTVGLLALRKSGFHLHTGKPLAGKPLVPSSTAVDTETSNTRARQVIVPAGLFGALILAHLLFVASTISNETKSVRFRELQCHMAERGGQISRNSQGEVCDVKLHQGAVREDLRKIAEYSQLASLSLANSAIQDDDIELLANFYQLHTLDLSRTEITDAALEKLAKCKNLQQLAIGGTKCTATGIARLLENKTIAKLDLSDMGIDDEQLSEITENSSLLPEVFVLSRNPLTNSGVAELIRVQEHNWNAGVDLTDCNVDESCLVADSYTELILDGTQVSESGLARRLTNLTVNGTLSMDRTRVSDSILAFLGLAKIGNLKLGETLITEQNLYQLGRASIGGLSLNSRKFNGSCFANWKPAIERLDMSHSGVLDENIPFIAKLPSLLGLNLRDTCVTDNCLDALSASDLMTIDLCETQVTADGIAKHDWDGKQLKVTADQFTEAEFKHLSRLCQLSIEPP